mmetsp:Transcript_15878/g.33319  ORF Transcript_15878/g.33319 Transcript_15878/m.33319 type:complete len:391 (-) Transcript_15878:95-1267(-)
MMRPFLFTTLLLGSVISQVNAFREILRPKYPVDAKKGCDPNLPLTIVCPVKMECFADKNFENGGRCECNPLWYKIPAMLPFDDSEWDDGFTTEDCANNRLVRLIVGIFLFAIFTTSVAFFYTAVVIIVELIHVKSLKLNSKTSSLIILTYAAAGLIVVLWIYLMNQWDGEKTEYWYHWRRNIFTVVTQPANVIVDYEIVATWVDLWERTSKMSKSSSRNVIALRYFLRFVAFMMAFGFGLIIRSSSMAVLLSLSMLPSISGIIFVSIGGYLINKTICPDKNDVENRNWPVAESIRRASLIVCSSKLCEIIGLLGMLVTRNHPQLGYSYGFFNVLFWFMYIMRMWGWLHYLIYSCRRNLKKYAKVDVSPYFGFALVGLNELVGKYFSPSGE